MSAAPGAPGLPPTWCSSAKEMVGCSLGHARLWFTIGGGIINEVYYPRLDIPQIRDLGFIVGDGAGFRVEVKRLWKHELRLAAPGAPAVHVVHHHERFDLTLRVTPCEHRDVLLIEVTLDGDAALRPYALRSPRCRSLLRFPGSGSGAPGRSGIRTVRRCSPCAPGCRRRAPSRWAFPPWCCAATRTRPIRAPWWRH